MLLSEIISIHALLAESDTKFWALQRATTTFLSTLSLRRATNTDYWTPVFTLHFYPRSPCGERRVNNPVKVNVMDFYPRSPCGERHQLLAGAIVSAINFYPRSPCGERPSRRAKYCAVPPSFLSTLSLRRATVRCLRASLRPSFLSTLSLRRAT